MRVARPTERLEEMARFYGTGVGLARLSAFRDHDGYSGVVFGAPDERAQLEITSREGALAPPPTEDSHLVLYYDDADEQARAVARLRAMGFAGVTPRNPWWGPIADAFEDPDGWEVILVRPARSSQP